MKPRTPVRTVSCARMAAALLGLAVATRPISAEIIADSVADFSGVQGANNWYYGFYESPFQMADFQELPFFGGGLFGADYWHETEGPGGFWTLIRVREQHPNGTNSNGDRLPIEQWAVRRWVSSIAGPVNVTGSYTEINGTWDGVIGSIVVDDTLMWSGNIDVAHPSQTFDFVANVQAGSVIDFVLAPGGNDVNDATDVVALITWVPEPSTVVFAGAGIIVLLCLAQRRRTAPFCAKNE